MKSSLITKCLLWACLTFSIVSCSDFLDITPQGSLTSDVYFKDQASVEDALARVYSSINWRFFRLGRMYYTTHEVASDDISIVDGDAYYTSVQNFTNETNNWYVEMYWDRWYGYINDCNQVIALAEKYQNEEGRIQEAQARYFRAYHHFDLLNVFGEIVIRDHIPSAKEYNIPKSSEEEVYNLIIRDLEFAIEHLPLRSEWGTSNLGRVTKGTARGLLSMVYLFKQDYENAYKYAKDVIDSHEYGLDASYRNLFAPDNTYSIENMMPGHYTYQNIAGRTRNPMVEFFGIPGSGIGSAFFAPSENLVNAYESGDPRKDATIFEKGDIIEGYPKEIKWGEGWKYANKKTIWPYNTWPNGDYFSQELNLTFLRYAEILLIYAEAANEIGKTEEALNALEQVRSRARENKDVLPHISERNKDHLRELIWNERRIELAFEGRRWFDLMRYEKVVPGYSTNLLKGIGRSNFVYDKYSKFPIPLLYITSSNGVLEQNKYWK